MATKKANKAQGKVVLYANVSPENKEFIRDKAEELSSQGMGNVSESAVIERILTSVRTMSYLQKSCGLTKT